MKDSAWVVAAGQRAGGGLRGDLRGLFNVAGGLPYHIAALRYRGELWTPYREAVARVLADWSPVERDLVIVGPSAGWNLPHAFLQRFDRVVAVEPDPLARWLLQRRFRGVAWQMDTDDYFTPHAHCGWTSNTDRLFDRYPRAALLFSEFLGQLLALYPDAVALDGAVGATSRPAFVAWKRHLCARLQVRTFCSLHDRWVSSEPPLRGPAAAVDLDGCLPLGLWRDQAVVVDPLTAHIVPAAHHRLLLWQRLPQRWHAMAAVWSRSPSETPDR